MEHIRKALQDCNFPPWALHDLQNKFTCKHNIHNGQTTTGNQSNNNNNGSNNKNISIVVPYIHELGERFKRTCNNLGSRCISKGLTSKPFSWPPGTGTTNHKKVGLYIDSNAHTSTAQMNTYGNQAYLLADRFKEHLRTPSPIHHHSHSTGHPVSPKHCTIIDRESPET